MRKAITFLGGAVAVALAAAPATAGNHAAGAVDRGDKLQRSDVGKGHNRPPPRCGKTVRRGPDAGYKVIFDGSGAASSAGATPAAR